jgi:hypothetical protein
MFVHGIFEDGTSSVLNVARCIVSFGGMINMRSSQGLPAGNTSHIVEIFHLTLADMKIVSVFVIRSNMASCRPRPLYTIDLPLGFLLAYPQLDS